MNKYLELGKINHLRIKEQTDHGFILTSSEDKEVLLPKRYVTEEMKIDDEIDVFIYTDSEDRIVATTERPKAMLNEFAVMKVLDTASFGAFMDWGLSKDLFVPKMLQRDSFIKGQSYLIYVAYDEKTHRLIGTQKYEKFLDHETKDLKRNQEVEIIPFAKTDLGYKVLINDRHEGLVFHSEIFKPLNIGEKSTGYVKIVRDDGKVDILLRPIGKKSDKIASQKIMDYLNNHGGMAPFNYKSAPERVKELLGLSRKNFKRGLTKLIESKKIDVKENGTFLKN